MSKLRYIVWHWTAGGWYPNDIDRAHYHFMVDKDGGKEGVHEGRFKPEANARNLGQVPTGQYAAHCGGGNSYAIGLALCGMAGYSSRANVGKYPLTRKQFEAACEKTAELCIEYEITPSPMTVYTHYEFGKRRPDTTSKGKPDITYLPFKPELKPDEIGNFIRSTVRWYITKIKKEAKDG
jgi:hypothetical protein